MSIIGTCPRSLCRILIQRCPCRGIGAATPGHSLPTYSSITASVHRLQFVHSATSMIMFHFCMASLQATRDWTGSLPSRRSRFAFPSSFRRLELRRLERLADLLVLLHAGEGFRHVLGAPVP